MKNEKSFRRMNKELQSALDSMLQAGALEPIVDIMKSHFNGTNKNILYFLFASALAKRQKSRSHILMRASLAYLTAYSLPNNKISADGGPDIAFAFKDDQGILCRFCHGTGIRPHVKRHRQTK
jgi:hypothetical protein